MSFFCYRAITGSGYGDPALSILVVELLFTLAFPDLVIPDIAFITCSINSLLPLIILARYILAPSWLPEFFNVLYVSAVD